jgi:hypothetical protein
MQETHLTIIFDELFKRFGDIYKFEQLNEDAKKNEVELIYKLHEKYDADFKVDSLVFID